MAHSEEGPRITDNLYSKSLHNFFKIKKKKKLWFCYVLVQSVLLVFFDVVSKYGAFHRGQAANGIRANAINLRQK